VIHKLNNYIEAKDMKCDRVRDVKLLKIAILAQLDSQTITEQLAPRLREAGHQVDIIDLSIVPKDNFINQPEIQTLTHYDIVYYRSGLNPTDNSGPVMELEALLEKHQVHTINLHFTKHPYAHSKIYETKQAEKHGLAIPKSLYSPDDDFSSLSEQLGLPFVIKTEYGTGGKGVYLINDSEELTKVKKAHQETSLLYQSFIPHDFEYRVYMIDGVVICIYKKAPSKDDFRSNESQGAEMIKADHLDQVHTEELTKLTQTTFNIFEFEIFVADFMLDKNTGKFYFTEINLNPGWEIFEADITGIDVIRLTIDYFEKIGPQSTGALVSK